MTLDQQDKVFLLTSFGVAAVGVGLMVGGFILRFGRGFGTFVTYAKADDDFLQLGRLDIVFGLFTAAAGVLLISFFIALFATLKRNKFLLYTYCGMIALMIVIQLVAGLLGFQYSDSIKVLNNDDTGVLHQSLNKTIAIMQANNGVIQNDDQSNFWKHTQNVLSCCGVVNSNDWGPYASDQSILSSTNCYPSNKQKGCEKQIHDRIAQDSQYLAVASMGVLLVEIIASFLAGYRAYNLNYENQSSM